MRTLRSIMLAIICVALFIAVAAPVIPPGPSGSAGTAGAAGANGATWLSGSGAPSAGAGVNGDFYLDTATSDVYKKVTGTWVLQVNIKGATGSAGSNGAAGAAGKNACSVDVCASGCTYTSVGTAVSTEATGVSICVKAETFSESSSITVKASQVVIFSGSIINLDNAAYFRASGADIKLLGRLTITGNGADSPTNASNTILFRFDGANIDTSGLYLEASLTGTTSGESTTVGQIVATDSTIGPIWLTAVSNDSGGGGTTGVAVYGTDNILLSVTIDGITDTGSANTSYGLSLFNADRTIATVNSGAITTTTGNGGIGVFINSDVTNSILNGVSLGSDGANLTNSGGATNKTANMTTS